MSATTRSIPRIYLAEARFEMLRTYRVPGFTIPTLLFPALFYTFFAVVMGSRMAKYEMATYLLATYGTFGIMSPALFGFGVNTAVERGLGWLRLKRATPMPPMAYFVGKLTTAIVFASVVLAILFSLAATAGNVTLEPTQWLLLAVTLMLGTIPFCAMGLAFGSWLGPQSAAPVVNIVYMASAVFSGLWFPIILFPEPLKLVAHVLPPYHLAQLALGVVGLSEGEPVWMHIVVLAAFGVVGLVAATAGFRRPNADA